jgi:asparagine synthase (glutamine-hydrolysing)
MNTNPFSGCGIVGILQNKNNKISDFIKSRFNIMLNSLAHRGPDGSGVYEQDNLLLGHRRLSILDVSNKGNQPMTRDYLSITMNGEIYNFKEIRKLLESKGYIFESDTDTEVAIRSYQEWGADALNKFNGMFAFAIWDNNKNHLFLARDRIGKKPFYYYLDTNSFVFASEVEAILLSGIVKNDIDYNALEHHIFATSFLETEPDRTLINNVKSLLPGHYMVISSDLSFKVNKYWDLPENKIEYNTDSKINQNKLETLFRDSVENRLVSDVPVSAFLSGGIDSSLINYFATELSSQKFTSITITYPEGGKDPFSDADDMDLFYSKELAKSLSNKIEHKIIPITSSDISLKNIDEINDLASFADDDRLLSIYKNYECVSKLGYKVVLNGQGADEIMAGYIGLKYFYETMLDVQNPTISTIKKMFPARSVSNNIANPESLLIANKIYNNVYDNYYSFSGSPDEKIHRFLIKSQLLRILKFEDYLSMQHGVESRLPFLDYRLVEFAFQIPFQQHYNSINRTGKVLLREIALKYLPEQIAKRPKQAFPIANSNKKYIQLLQIFESNKEDIIHNDIIHNYFNKKTLLNNSYKLSMQELWLILVIWRWHVKLTRLIH